MKAAGGGHGTAQRRAILMSRDLFEVGQPHALERR